MARTADERLAKVRLIGFDIDGVFTDGRFYLADSGVETKAFHTQDGYGVRALLKAGVAVAVVSGRRSGAVERRMAELGVEHVILGSRDKVRDFSEVAATLSKKRRTSVTTFLTCLCSRSSGSRLRSPMQWTR